MNMPAPDEPMGAGTEPGTWVAAMSDGHHTLLTPLHANFERSVDVLAKGRRAVGGRLQEDFEILCRRDDIFYLCSRTDDGEWDVIGATLVAEDDNETDAVDDLRDLAQSELFADEEYDEWLEAEATLAERQSRGRRWLDFVVGDDATIRVPHPDHPEFEYLVSESSDAASSRTGWGPMSSSNAERVVMYAGHQFLVTGDPEGGGQEIELIDDSAGALPAGRSHPSSLTVPDDLANEISLGYDEDLDHEDQFEVLTDLDEEDLGEDADWVLADRAAREEAQELLATLRIGHRGVAVVGPGASPTLPSSDPWLAFPTTVSIDELSSKASALSIAIVDGREMVFTDGLELAVAARLAWPEAVIRITHEDVSIFDTELRAFVARGPRVG